ncbi:hypothetical protein A4V15_21035 [Pseudomonas oryzihabitans]|uniref:Uncharacterized protein n=1 Tax=Pseudomonas oryzihabitans TaxID=47885 RepID=A0A178LC46_9PSED|nr:hypothetical protein A4V15_21035 [Pseudomonas oryzihabitans]
MGFASAIVGNGVEFGDERSAVVLRGLAVTVFGWHGGLLAVAETGDRVGCFLVMDFTLGGWP